MDKLSRDLWLKIFVLLDHRHLASVASVCRDWRMISATAELWEHLFVRRWGKKKARSRSRADSERNTWRTEYEIQDRCDRIGKKTTFVREGTHFYLVNRGVIVRLLGSSTAHQSPSKRPQTAHQPAVKPEPQDIVRSAVMNMGTADAPLYSVADEGSRPDGPSPSVFDKLLFFITDLESTCRQAKKARL